MTEPKKPRAKKGTGTVIERPSGWYAQWSSRDPGTGARRVHKRGAFKSEREARKFLTSQIAKVDAGTFVAAPKPKLMTEVLDSWFASKTKVRATTLAAYRVAVENWLKPRIGGVKLPALTEQHVQQLAKDLAATGGKSGGPLSARSVQLALVTLKQSINYAIRQGWVLRNVAAEVSVRPNSRTMKIWTKEQTRAFLASIRADRLAALYTLALTRAMRRGELAGLRWDAVDLEAGHLRVEQTVVLVDGHPQTSKPKTNASGRKVPLDPDLVTVLRTHRKRQLEDRLAAGTGWTDTGYVFTNEVGEPLHPDHISNRFEALVRDAKLPAIRLHDCRHTAASLMLDAKVPTKTVSELLGHSDVRVTLAIYAHVMPGTAEEAAAALTRMVL